MSRVITDSRSSVKHIWMVIGIAKTCTTMKELRDKMAQMNWQGRG